MDLATLQKEVGEWADRNFPNSQSWEPLLGIQEECGELSHAHLKMHQGIRGSSAEHLMAKIDAIGDILILMAHYCHKTGISLDAAITTTWSEVKQRDWQKNKLNGQTS